MTARKTWPLVTDPSQVTTNFATLSPWAARIYEDLADGNAHHVDDILMDAATRVPAADALRHSKRQAAAQGRRSPCSAVHLLAAGQRRKASQALGLMRRLGLFTEHGDMITAVPALLTVYRAYQATQSSPSRTRVAAKP